MNDLQQLLESRFFVDRFAVVRDEKTRRHYRRALRWLAESNPEITPTPRELLTDRTCRKMLRYLLEHRHQEAVTANTSRKCVVAFAAWCRDEGLIDRPIRVEKLPEQLDPPASLTEEQITRLWSCAKQASGIIQRMPADRWWLALLAIEFDAAIRASELLALRWEWIDFASEVMRVPACVRKGKRRGEVYRFAPWSLEHLQALQHSATSPYIFGKPSLRTYYAQWDKMQKAAGLPNGRKWKTHALRRTVATFVASAGGDPARALRQMTPAVAWDRYVDPSAAARPASSIAVPLVRIVAG